MADMTREQAVEVLRLHNAWRRDKSEENPYPQQSPALIGRAIDFALTALTAQPAGEVVAWARQSGDPNDDAFVISAKVKRLWLASNPKRVARYTRPLYTTHVPCWALPAVESALSMLDLQGYWHSDLAAFRDWLKEKSA